MTTDMVPSSAVATEAEVSENVDDRAHDADVDEEDIDDFVDSSLEQKVTKCDKATAALHSMNSKVVRLHGVEINENQKLLLAATLAEASQRQKHITMKVVTFREILNMVDGQGPCFKQLARNRDEMLTPLKTMELLSQFVKSIIDQTSATMLTYMENVAHIHNKENVMPMTQEEYDKAYELHANVYVPDEKNDKGSETFQRMMQMESMRFRNPPTGIVNLLIDGGHRMNAVRLFMRGLIPLVLQKNSTKLVVFYEELCTHEDLQELYEEMLNKPMYVGCIDKTTPMVSYGCLCFRVAWKMNCCKGFEFDSVPLSKGKVLEIQYNCMLSHHVTNPARFMVLGQNYYGSQYVEDALANTQKMEAMDLKQLTEGWKLAPNVENLHWTLWYLVLAVSLREKKLLKYAALAGTSSVFVRNCMMRGPPQKMLDAMTLFGLEDAREVAEGACPEFITESGEDMTVETFMANAFAKIERLPIIIEHVERALCKMGKRAPPLKQIPEVQHVSLALLVFCDDKKALDEDNVLDFMRNTAGKTSMAWLWEASFKPNICGMLLLSAVWKAYAREGDDFDVESTVRAFIDKNSDKKIPGFGKYKAMAARYEVHEEDEDEEDEEEQRVKKRRRRSKGGKVLASQAAEASGEMSRRGKSKASRRGKAVMSEEEDEDDADKSSGGGKAQASDDDAEISVRKTKTKSSRGEKASFSGKEGDAEDAEISGRKTKSKSSRGGKASSNGKADEDDDAATEEGKTKSKSSRHGKAEATSGEKDDAKSDKKKRKRRDTTSSKERTKVFDFDEAVGKQCVVWCASSQNKI